MRLAILGSAESWYASDLRRAASASDDVCNAAFSKISAMIGGSQMDSDGELQLETEGQALHEFDAVLVRTMPPGSLEQVVFRMDALAVLESRGVAVFNRPKAIEVAVDKFLSTAKLQAAGLQTPLTIACQDYDSAMSGFERLGGDVVLKPLFGGEGRGILRLQDPALAHRTFKTLLQLNAVLYLQPFIAHDHDTRLLCIGERVLAMRRRNHSDWRTNISQGGVAEPVSVSSDMECLALRACRAVGAELGGVDVIQDAEGRELVLEVNAVPGWRALQRVHEVDVAAMVLDFLRTTISRGAQIDA